MDLSETSLRDLLTSLTHLEGAGPMKNQHGVPMTRQHVEPMTSQHVEPMTRLHGVPMTRQPSEPMTSHHGGPQQPKKYIEEVHTTLMIIDIQLRNITDY